MPHRPSRYKPPLPHKSWSEQATALVGAVGTVVTISLTVWNARASSEITAKTTELQALEMRLKERATGVDESKERVDRYKWVLSLLGSLNEADPQKRTFMLSLMRLALTDREAQQLFTGLQVSPDKALQAAGRTGIAALQNEPVALLVGQLNANTRPERRHAMQALLNEYKASSQAIGMVLDTYGPAQVDGLSPSAVINGLFFLNASDFTAWSSAQRRQGRGVLETLRAKNAGPQTAEQLQQLQTLLGKAAAE